MRQLQTHSPEETVAAGRDYSRTLRPGDCVALTGELGAGKTRFILGIAEGLGVRMHVTSPTFTLINEYPAPFGVLVHIDLYRIRRREEIAELGIDEYQGPRCICVIEWAERLGDLLSPGCRRVRIEHGVGETERVLSFDDPGVTAG